MASKKAESKSNSPGDRPSGDQKSGDQKSGDQKSAAKKLTGKKPADSKQDSAKAGGDRSALPFEPASNRKPSEKKQARQNPVVSEAAKRKAEAMLKPKDKSTTPATLTQSAIPDAVSKRMIRRMALFSGIPSLLGMSTFIVSYLLISNEWFKLPNVVVLLISAGFFGLGVLGLSYGVLSTSWDEDRAGTRLGWGEFTTNFGRMTQAWRSARNQSKS